MNAVAVFDFDGTVIRGDSVVALLLYARRRGCLSAGGLCRAAAWGLAYRLRLTDALRAKQRSHAFLTAMPAGEREAFLRDFARTLAERAYPGALERIRSHREKGDLVLLCSASCACYMRYVAPLLGADDLLCTPCAPDGAVVGPNCRGEEKVRRVSAWMAERGLDGIAAAYGDSKSDLPLLRRSACPVLVNASRGLCRRIPQAGRVCWREKK